MYLPCHACGRTMAAAHVGRQASPGAALTSSEPHRLADTSITHQCSRCLGGPLSRVWSRLSAEAAWPRFLYAVVSDRTQRFLSSKAKSRATLQDLLDTYTATLTLDKLSKTLRQHLRQEGAEGQEGEGALEEKLAKPLEKVAGTTGAQRLLGWRGTVG